MAGFPDESSMERSADGTEPIRGGSIGFNRILSLFADDSATDRKPKFNAILISAFTIFRNVWAMNNDAKTEELEERFVKDVNLFLDYYDTYLSFVRSRLSGDKFCPIIMYFPDYKHLAADLRRENSGKRLLLNTAYKMFLARHGNYDGQVKKLDNIRCFWIRAGDATYPHKEVARKFKEITAHPESLYTSGDPVGLITHITLDYHITHRIRNILLLESYTAKIREPKDFKLRLDKEGRIPFQSALHVVLGDDDLIKTSVTSKIRKAILEAAEKDRWNIRGEDDVRLRVSKLSNISTDKLRRYNFS